jgi:murein L,D-transpeptidase YafK
MARGSSALIRHTGWARTLLASAAIAAAVALAGCETDGGMSPTVAAKAMAPLSADMMTLLDQKSMPKESPILVRIFKEESELEVWKQDTTGQYALLKTYPICRWSGELGPKIKQGDRQAPEGFYSIRPGQMNPNSAWYLSIDTGFPNAYDRANDRTGAFLMVHGDCSSAGCYAMTDEQMGEIYALGREAFLGGQKAFQIQAYPFHMTARNMARHRNNPAMPFWRMLKEGNDHFEATRQEPKVSVCEKRYVFDADTSGRFDPRAKCPAFQVPSEIATPVAAKQQRDEQEFASLVARNTPTAPVKTGADGGMNELFVAKLRSQDRFDNNGRIFSLASTQHVPAMGNNVNPPKNVGLTGDTETTTASVSAPPPAPVHVASADAGASPSMFGGLFGSGSKLFGGDSEKPAAAPPAPAAAAPKPRTAAQPKIATAHAQPAAGAIRPAQPAQPRSQVAEDRKAAPAAPQQATATASAWPTPAPAAPQAQSPAPAMISGAAPVVQSSTFNNRWGDMR